jgi:hypothetical protein
MKGQVFLGGSCGMTSWRRDIAIPALEAAGVTYWNPQLGVGEWTAEHEAIDMQRKAEADVLLFVISGRTRAVASIAEVAYLIATGRPLALVVDDVPPGSFPEEQDDLNRGRLFVRTMAAQHGLSVFPTVEAAVQHAIALARSAADWLTMERLRAILDDVQFKESRFLTEECGDGFLIQLSSEEVDVKTGEPEWFTGRKWHVPRSASCDDVVRTAFKAVATWQEHETRERFLYRGKPVFGPHTRTGG